jgi:ABC-type transport system involved in multi-copper enzyme maturation permease subunit
MISFFEQFTAITRNTFLESIRQPIVLVVAIAATIMIVLCNPFSAWTMRDDQRMFIDLGLATVFLATAILSAFIAANVLGREIDNRTVLTVVSKPVSRPVFIAGKFVGVSLTMMLSLLYLGLVYMLVEMHGTLMTVRDPFHMPVIVFGNTALLVAVLLGAWMNYFYGKNFSAWTVGAGVPLLGFAYFLALFFDAEWNSVPLAKQFEPEMWKALLLIGLAMLVLNATAIAASTRLGQVFTLTIVIGVFLLGLLSDWMLGSRLASDSGMSPLLHGFFSVCRAMLPNFQLFWLSDALTQKRVIPLDYIGYAIPYAAALVASLLSVATILFQRREVG